ncbi:hypothetical protein [Nonomuraea wenchangensis]|uniref:hypothetical protein n=1 Tax=Nonomuraea wenchangensis TaxID=568860 RepID=UPI00332DAB81
MTALDGIVVRHMPIPTWDHLADIPTVVMVEAAFRADSPYLVRLAVERQLGVDAPLDVLTEGLIRRAECGVLAAWPLDEEFVRWDLRTADPVALRVPRALLAWHLESLPEIAREPDWDAFARVCAEEAS